MTANGYLSKRALLKAGIALALLPHVFSTAEEAGETVASRLPGIDVLTREGRSMSVAELRGSTELDPGVRAFLLAELARTDII